MTQAKEGSTSANGDKHSPESGSRSPPQTSSEPTTATATEMVAAAITTAQDAVGLKNCVEHNNTPSSKVEGWEVLSADSKGGSKGGALTDRGAGVSPRPVKPGTDLRASFLAAVGNTISQTVRTVTKC